jgi:hypothetical protein
MPEDELIYDREDEESQLPKNMRNLDIKPNDDGCVSETSREAEELP